MVQTILKDLIRMVPYVQKMPSRHVWFDYDKEADVMYVSFEKPQRVTDTEVLKNGVLVRKRGARIVGLSILNASRF